MRYTIQGNFSIYHYKMISHLSNLSKQVLIITEIIFSIMHNINVTGYTMRKETDITHS